MILIFVAKGRETSYWWRLPLNPIPIMTSLRRSAWIAVCGCLMTGCTGLKDIETAGTAPEAQAASGEGTSDNGAANASRISPAMLQQRVMDFSDQYVSGLWPAFDEYIRTEPDAARRTSAQKWKVMLSATSMTIAGSRDPRMGLLDMAVFISAGRWALDAYWIPEVLGERAAPLRALYAEMERRIWREVAQVLTPAQQADLRSLIVAWEATNPPRHELLDVRLRNLDGVELSNFAEVSSARGLLAKIQRLLGKVDQSLLYGERVIFYMERMPRMLEQQSDLTIDRVAERFPIATVNPDFSQISALMAEWPQQLNDTLLAQDGLVTKSLPDVRASIESVERLTGSLQETLVSANQLAGKMEKLPFERADYLAALQETSTSLTQLNSLINGLNHLLDETATADPKDSKVAALAGMIDARADVLLDKAFHRGLLLLGAFFAGVLVSLLAARVILRRPSGGENPKA